MKKENYILDEIVNTKLAKKFFGIINEKDSLSDIFFATAFLASYLKELTPACHQQNFMLTLEKLIEKVGGLVNEEVKEK